MKRAKILSRTGGFIPGIKSVCVVFPFRIDRDREKIRILISIVFCSEGVLFSWAAKSDSFTVFQICWSGLLH